MEVAQKRDAAIDVAFDRCDVVPWASTLLTGLPRENMTFGSTGTIPTRVEHNTVMDEKGFVSPFCSTNNSSRRDRWPK